MNGRLTVELMRRPTAVGIPHQFHSTRCRRVRRRHHSERWRELGTPLAADLDSGTGDVAA